MSEFENAGGGRGEGCEESNGLFQPEYDGGFCFGSGTRHFTRVRIDGSANSPKA